MDVLSETMPVEAVIKNVEMSHKARVEAWAGNVNLFPFRQQQF